MILTKTSFILATTIIAIAAMLILTLQAIVIVDESWADGGRDNGADPLGRAGLDADLSASSSMPNDLYRDLPGYMMDMDVHTGANDENLSFRRHLLGATTGRLLATTTGFSSIGNGGDPYTFAQNTSYTGSVSATKNGATLDLTATPSGTNVSSTLP